MSRIARLYGLLTNYASSSGCANGNSPPPLYIQNGKMPWNGDKDKAMKAVYEVVTGTGVGVGREGDDFLPLGSDMTARVQTVQDYLQHGLDVFGEVANSVDIDK